MTNGDWTPESGAGFDAPPIEAMGSLEPEPSKWPSVIGITSIVFASLGVLCYGCNSIWTGILQPMMMGSIPEDQRPPTPQGAQLIFQFAQLCVAWILSVWLLIAGIGLVRRRAWSRGHLIAWSFVKIATTVLSTVVGLLMLDDIVKQINDSMTAQGQPAPFVFSKGLFLVILIVSLIWFLIWPCFLILWLARDNVKDEAANWAAESAARI